MHRVHSTFAINLDSRDDWLRSSWIPRTRKMRLLARRGGRSSVSSSSRSPRRQEEAIAREDRSSGRLFDSGRGRTERWVPRQSPRRERVLSSFSGAPSLRTLFHPPFRRFFAARGSSSTRRDGIALTTGTSTSFSPYAGHTTRLFLHPHIQVRINRCAAIIEARSLRSNV